MVERLVWAEINVRNFLYNLSSVKHLVGPKVKVMAVVKANAYGHGAIELSKAAETLHSADYFGVVCLYEARQLRESGIKTPILILNYIDSESLSACVDLNLSLNIMEISLLRELDATARNKHKVINIHVKIDTGMHRLGLTPEQAIAFIPQIENFHNVRLEGVFTHFATSDEKDLSFTREQLQNFTSVLRMLKEKRITIPVIHSANSAATLRMAESHFDMVRPGIVLYGMPSSNDFTLPFVTKPVMTLKTKIVQLRTINKGETVGYGRTFTAEKTTRVAALPVGYADGFRRAPHNWGHVLVRGRLVPVIGRVSMDQSSIDVTEVPGVSVGDEIVLIGTQGNNTLTTDDVAKQLGTINYEVTTALASRVSRVYLY